MKNKLTISDIAKVCHETNRAYCEVLGDTSQVPWETCPQNIKLSAMDGVKFHLDNPEAAAWSSHENWLKFKEADGWVYGPVKDLKKKEHPCMVPFGQLPVEQRIKDIMFKHVVDALRPLYNT